MARTVNDEASREAFASRLNEELDRVDYPRQGRASALAREFDVSHTTPGAWLNGSMPAVSILVKICRRLGLDFTYLCTGERSTPEATINMEVFRDAVGKVNELLKSHGWIDDVGIDRLGPLYMRAYIHLEEGSESQIMEDVRLAAGH